MLSFLAIGHYKITASQTGFKNSVQNDVELRVTDRIEVDFKMEVGAASEQVIDTKAVMDAPVLGRN